MQFQTGSEWTHQINLNEETFFWDSSEFNYSEVNQMWGIYEQTSVNLAPNPHLDDFAFTLWMKNGRKLEQSIKKSATAKAVFSFGFAGNTQNTALELQSLYHLLLNKTFNSRLEKYTNYYNNNQRWLLTEWDNGQVISSTESGDVYKDNVFFSNMWDGSCKISYRYGGGHLQNCIEFKKSGISNACYVDIRTDPDIVVQLLEKKLGLSMSAFDL